MAEGLWTALAGCLVPIAPALAITVAMNTRLSGMLGGDPLPFVLSVAAAFAWIALSLLGALLAPALRASRLTVRGALVRL
jgi:hypothetical protein